MIRGFRAGMLLAILAGCEAKTDRSVVYTLRTNDHSVEFDGIQKRATIGLHDFLIVRDPDDIRVVEGILRVGKREYGAVARGDRISVVQGQVSVNGQTREP